MKKAAWFLFVATLLVGASAAIAADAPTATAASGVLGTVDSSIGQAIANVVDKLQTLGVLWLSSFVMIQFVITNVGLLKSGADLEAVIAKFIGSMAWFGFCFYVVAEGPAFLSKVGNSFFGTATGLGVAYDAGALLDAGVTIGANLISSVQKAAGITDVGSVIIAGICGIFILLVMALIALKVFLMKVELGIIVMVSPISFAFLGLNALKDQGIAPFKSLISLFYRIIVLGVLITCCELLSADASKSITSIYDNAAWYSRLTGLGAGIWPVLFNITIGYLVIGFLAFKSDSIAASLSSGSTNLGTSDVASAAAIGAAVGGAIGTAGTNLGLSKLPQSMGNFMNKLSSGNGVGASNASANVGTGGVGTPPSKTDTPSFSKTVGSGAESAADSGINTGDSIDDSSPSSMSAGETPSTSSDSAASPALGGVPNRLPGDVAAESRKAERDAEREQRRQAKASGSAATAGIGGTGTAPTANQRGFRDHISRLGQHVAQERATVSASINVHHE